jgi:phosphate transport system permease protein
LSNGFNALNGSILLALMALPTIITVAEEAIRAVPKTFREASYALGASRPTTLWKVTLPAAMSGILAAGMLGLGRALGETMTVLMATGNASAFPNGFFDPVRTMTAAIAIELGETAQDTTHYFALFAVGAILFGMSLAVNILSEKIARRFRYKI